jgi:hypothetical protein
VHNDGHPRLLNTTSKILLVQYIVLFSSDKTNRLYTALSEILVTRVCGGSKFVKKKTIRKMLDLVADDPTPVNTLSIHV